MIKNLEEQLQKEKNSFLSFLLNNRFFKVWENQEVDTGSTFATLELFLTSYCNQSCEYCYLKNNKEIYPSEYDNKVQIINNLKIFLEYLIQKQYKINTIEIFSGDIWHTNFGVEILEIFLFYIKKGLKITQLLIPSNCYFVTKTETLIPIQNLIYSYCKEDVRLTFSISIDGKIVDNYSRPLDSKEVRNDEYYDDIFSFAMENGYGFHPMISAFSIEKQKENYYWWKQMCEKYSMNFYTRVMLLEVRNNDWTKEKIQIYSELIKIMLEDFYNSKYILKKNKRMIELLTRNWHYDNLSVDNYFPFLLNHAENSMPCTVDKDLTVRIGDLAICPCHRLAQKNNIYGYFEIENNKIVGIKAENTELATRILLGNPRICSPTCGSCTYEPICIKGCLGSQKEVTRDPFFPIDSVCQMLKAKYNTIYDWLEKKDIMKELYEIKIDSPQWDAAKRILFVWENLKNV